ncbi:MAG TPA: class I SAM-dependent methyltransferase [Gemmatimonadales bacterium]|nr:class I SAM-dependent methyltransferase [Gemmatimonadales bacterium]
MSDTARWVAIYRAMESERPDALFRDPYARRLAGERGAQIVESMPKGKAWAWPMIVRTAVMDELILRAVDRDGTDTVLNLAAGLDTRPYCMRLPPTLRWVEVDFPDFIGWKRDQLTDAQPVCALEHVGLDLMNLAGRQLLFAELAAMSRKLLVVSEGLLIYLTREQVGGLARDLAANPPFDRWLIDIATQRLLKMMEKTWGRAAAAGNAPFRFAPAEGTRFFEDHGWTEEEFRSTWDEAQRLNRADVPFAWLWRLLGRFSSAERREAARRMAGIALLRQRQPGATSQVRKRHENDSPV